VSGIHRGKIRIGPDTAWVPEWCGESECRRL
jgi:hypothetical protein